MTYLTTGGRRAAIAGPSLDRDDLTETDIALIADGFDDDVASEDLPAEIFTI